MATAEADLRELIAQVSRAVAKTLAANGGSVPAIHRADVAQIVAAEVTAALAATPSPTPSPRIDPRPIPTPSPRIDPRPIPIPSPREAGRGLGRGAPADGAASALARAELCASCIEQERRKSGRRAVVTTTGKNQRGIVARIAQGIADAGGDILDISQTLVADFFTMIIVVDMTGLEVPFAEFKARITRTVESLGAECLVMHEEVVTALQRV